MDVRRAIEARGMLLFPMSMCVASGIVCATCGALVWPSVEGPSIETSIDRGGEKAAAANPYATETNSPLADITHTQRLGVRGGG